MIPASYLFKDVFRQSFYDPDIAAAIDRHHRDHPGPGLFARLRRHHHQVRPAPSAGATRTV
jgi:hypothetical protein